MAEVKNFNLEEFTKTLEKRFGKGIMCTGADILEKPKKVISICPSLDIGLSGGIPEGSWVLCSGKPKCGKSTTSLHFAKKCIDAGKPVFYLDVEGRIKDMILRGIPGLDPKKVNVIHSEAGNIIDAEKYLSMGEDIIKNVPGCLLIVDSASALCAGSEQIADITGQTRNQGPKLLASFCRKLGNIVPVNNSIVWMIQHLIANTSGYGSPFMEDGGNKIVYQGDVKIRSKGFSDWKNGEQIIGQMVKWDVEFSALGAPGAKVESYIRYGKGIDETWEWAQMGIELGLIEKAGAWYNFTPIGSDLKSQGQEKICNLLNDDKKLLDSLKAKIKEMLCIKQEV